MRIDYLWANEPPGLYRIDGRQRGEESEEVSEEVTGLKDTIVFFGQNPRYFPWWTHQNGDDTLDIYTIRWYDCYFRMARFRRWQLKIHQNPFLEVMDGIAGIAGRYFHSSIYFLSSCRWATETWPAGVFLFVFGSPRMGVSIIIYESIWYIILYYKLL